MAKPSWAEASTSSIRDSFNKVSQRELDRVSRHTLDPQSKFNGIEALKPTNTNRNRYTNVFAWEGERVKLPVMKGFSDYINASNVKLTEDHKYIASQGPLTSTIGHFWSMCWKEAQDRNEDNIAVVMLTPLKEMGVVKCSKYWPDHDNPHMDLTDDIQDDGVKLTNLTVDYVDLQVFQSFTLSTLKLECESDSKTIYHYYYHDWADTRTPQNPDTLIELLDSLRSLQSSHNISTPIIHCSAGVGRTGTFIALDFFNHNRVLLTSVISQDPILEVLKQMRDSRMMMIQTSSQFIFLYQYFKQLLDLA